MNRFSLGLGFRVWVATWRLPLLPSETTHATLSSRECVTFLIESESNGAGLRNITPPTSVSFRSERFRDPIRVASCSASRGISLRVL